MFVAVSSVTTSQWIQMSSGMSNTENISSLAVKDNIILAGYTNGIFLSTNNGANWIHTSLYTRQVFSFAVINNDILAGTNDGIYKSTDNGYTWSQTSFTQKRVSALMFYNNVIYAGCGDYYNYYGVYNSTNNGTTWSQTSLNDKTVFTLAVKNNNICAGTFNYGIYVTSNGGINWTQSDLNYTTVYSISVNEVKAFAGTELGKVYSSSNNGINWLEVFSNNRGIPKIICIESNIFAGTFPSAGISNGIYVSTDNGGNWIQCNQGFQDLPWVGSFLTIDDKIYTGTENIAIWRRELSNIITPAIPQLLSPANNSINIPLTTNLIWNKKRFANQYHIQLSTDSAFSNFLVNDSTLTDSVRIVTGLANNTDYWWRVRSKNTAGVSNFSPIFKFKTILPLPSTPILISPLNNSQGESLTPLLNWDTASNSTSFGIQVSTDSLFGAIIFDSVVSISQVTVPSGMLSNNVRYYWKVRGSNVSGSGPWSVIWNFTSAPLAFHQNGDAIPKEFKLYNNFPNPFNPATNIRFDVPKSGNVEISVYDMLGKEITTLVNLQLQPGTYETEWDASGYSSGIYYYKITCGDFTQTKKMVLVK